MAQITTDAYLDLANYIQNNWNYIELRHSDDTPVIRINTTDPRVTWTHSANSQLLELTAVIKGSDVDITLPQTIAKTALFKVASGGTAYSVEVLNEPFTLNMTADEVTIKHKIQVPKNI